MSIGMNIALMVALALAATGISTQHQAGVSNSSTGGRGQNLNHNETLVRDTKPNLRQDDLSSSLDNEQSFVSRLFTSFAVYRGSAACPPIMCNHNETLVRDTTTSPRAEDPGSLAVEQSVTSQLFTMFSLYRIGSCSHWHCNHNETLVRASASM